MDSSRKKTGRPCGWLASWSKHWPVSWLRGNLLHHICSSLVARCFVQLVLVNLVDQGSRDDNSDSACCCSSSMVRSSMAPCTELTLLCIHFRNGYIWYIFCTTKPLCATGSGRNTCTSYFCRTLLRTPTRTGMRPHNINFDRVLSPAEQAPSVRI